MTTITVAAEMFAYEIVKSYLESRKTDVLALTCHPVDVTFNPDAVNNLCRQMCDKCRSWKVMHRV